MSRLIKLSFTELQPQIFNRLAHFFENQEICDMEIRGALEPLLQPIKVHSLYLALFSPIFQQALEDPIKFKLDPPKNFEVIHKATDGRFFITIDNTKTSTLRLLFQIIYRFQLDLPIDLLSSLEQILILAKELGFSQFVPKIEKALSVHCPVKDIIQVLSDAILSQNDVDLRTCLENLETELPINYPSLRQSIIKAPIDLIKVIVGNISSSRLPEDLNSIIIKDWIISNAKVRGKYTHELLIAIKDRPLSREILQIFRNSRKAFSSGEAAVTEFLLDALTNPNPTIKLPFLDISRSDSISSQLQDLSLSGDISYLPNGFHESYILLIGGCEGSGKKHTKISVFDPRTETFLDETQILPNLPTGIKQAAVVCHNNTIYVIGGLSDLGSPSNRVLIYEKDSSSWINGPALHNPRMNHSAVVFQSRIYVFGGMGVNHWRLNSMEILDIMDNSRRNQGWKKGTNFPSGHGVYGHACVVSNEGFVIIGGCSNHGHTRSVFEFHINKKAWIELPSMQCCRAHANAAYMDGNIYVCGGHDGKRFSNAVECLYRPEDYWATLDSMKSLRSGGILIPIPESKCMYLFGGSQGGNSGNLMTIEKFDADNNEWSIIKSHSPLERFGLSGCVFPDYL